MFEVTYESYGQRMPRVSEEVVIPDHLQSCIVLYCIVRRSSIVDDLLCILCLLRDYVLVRL